MPVRNVVMFGDERLRQQAIPVDLQISQWKNDAADLVDTLASLKERLGFGNALAAPQIGSPFRMIAFNGSLGNFLAINPRITWTSEEMFPLWDDCFSLPSVCAAVMRHKEISFECIDSLGKLVSFPRLEGAQAELVQHEVDHLNGILMVDRLVKPGAIIAREMLERAAHPALVEATVDDRPLR
ncbi:Peptide deformylase [Hyphomicrobiales bacterium]|nr:Peptide deformylase [Hyphomicrobiales bacterium]CAH1691213.1 Peptide deformylase [Hyphomicrobiales bacterium]